MLGIGGLEAVQKEKVAKPSRLKKKKKNKKSMFLMKDKKVY